MRIAVFGATGRTGHHLVEQALATGHEVVAVVRNAARLEIHDERVRAVETDVFDPEGVTPAIAKCDAVVSSLGANSPRAPQICQAGARSIVQAMASTDVRRLVVVSNSALAPMRGDSAFRRLVLLLLGQVLKRPFEDLRRMELDVQDSATDWTLLQPARMTNGPHTRRYRLAVDQHVPNGWRISRADVADAILRVLDDSTTIGKIVSQAY